MLQEQSTVQLYMESFRSRLVDAGALRETGGVKCWAKEYPEGGEMPAGSEGGHGGSVLLCSISSCLSRYHCRTLYFSLA